MEDVVLVRIYGNKTELLVDRDEEVKSFRVLQAHGCAPQLYCTFNNGLCYEFIQGEALDPKHVCNPAIFRLIARQLAKIHAIHAHNGWIPKSNLWLKMGKYFSLIPTGFADEDLNKRFLSDIPSSQILQEEMTWMKEILSNLGSPVVLCHNDLLCKNIIYNEKQGRYLTLPVSKVDSFDVLNGPLIFVSVNKFNADVRIKNIHEVFKDFLLGYKIVVTVLN